MKIGYITPYYPPAQIKGGMEISLQLLAGALAKLGHQVLIFVPNYQKDDQTEGDNPKIFRIKFGKDTVFSRTNSYSVKYFVKKILDAKVKFEIIDAYNWFQPAQVLAKTLKIPYICSVRDATPICDFRVDQNPQAYPFFEYFFKRFSTYGVSPRQIINGIYGFLLTRQNLKIISQASCLTFASLALEAIFKKYNPCGQVINSIGLANFKRQKVKITGVDFGKDKVVVYAGRLSNGKGAGFLFEAAKKVIEKSQNIKFVFVGDGELRSKISDPKFKDKIFCLGKKPHNFVLSLIEIARVTVVPSIIFEAFPRIGVESVSLGTPVIGTKIGGIPEAVGEAGILVEAGNIHQLADAILKISRNDYLYKKLKSKTKIQAAKFLPEKIAQKVIYLYRKVLN